MSELRRDPIHQRWIVVLGQTWDAVARRLAHAHGPSPGPCPFCPGHEGLTPPEVFALRNPGSRPNEAGWTVRVVPNKFPFLRIDEELARTAEGIYDRVAGSGAHEIVIESPSHAHDWNGLGAKAITQILQVYRERIRSLPGDSRLRSTIVARNYGPGLAVLPHPHSHIVALPVVPRRIAEELRNTREYHHRKERCVFCDTVREERADGRRLIGEQGPFVAFVPYAARYPLEFWFLPTRHAHDFGTTADEELPALAELLCATVRRLHILLPHPAYSMVLHSSPFGAHSEARYHWHIELRVRLPLAEGFEWGTGLFVNPVAPEAAARLLRDITP
ncbi:MAG: galactose-1-phosphate uridylyltransferase [Candidatus Methylomirabilales bacterium]